LLATLLRCFAVPDMSSHNKWESVERELTALSWDKNKILATAGRAVRSGYVVPEASGLGEMVVRIQFRYLPSPLFLDLCKTVDFDDAVRREAQAHGHCSTK
jgi:hypothetical protein